MGGNVNNNGNTALILLFYKNPEKTDFNSNCFKLLWEKEKDIEVDRLKEYIQRKPELKEKVISAVPDAAAYYKWISILLYTYLVVTAINSCILHKNIKKFHILLDHPVWLTTSNSSAPIQISWIDYTALAHSRWFHQFYKHE